MFGPRYRVKQGDSLSSIAQAHLGQASRWPRIMSYNNRRDVVQITGRALTDPNRLQIGQLLLIPPPEQIRGKLLRSPDQVHPQQIHVPQVIPQTAEARMPGKVPDLAFPQNQTTTINSIPIKYKLELIPKQTIEGPNYIGTMQMDGQIVIWKDKLLPVLTLGNKGTELATRAETKNVFMALIQDEKIVWDPVTNKATFENMVTLSAHGTAPSQTSFGVAADSSNPTPAVRFKFQWPKLQGRLGEHLYVADSVTLTVDLRPKTNDDDDITRRGLATAPVRALVPTPQPWWQRTGNWIADHKIEVGVSVVVLAVVASNFVTAGADSEADPLVGAWAARTVQAARAARAAAAGAAVGGGIAAFSK